MHLRDVDDANRQIGAFNAAAETANRGETKKAIEMLDELLETVAEEAVVLGPMTVRKQLQTRSKGMRRAGAGY